MKNVPTWLFIGTYPNAYIFADTRIEKGGDYKEIGRIYFSPFSMQLAKGINKEQYKEALDIMAAEYEQIKNNIDKPLIVSATGQTVKVKN